ncbi:MAG: hemerythrin family protein [Pseudomonadota bacterium]
MVQDDNAVRKATMEAEHHVQFELIRALQDAVTARQDGPTVEAVLERLIDYSEAHFLSEELLMRLASYDDFEAHAEHHRQLLESLRQAQEKFRATGQHALLDNVPASTLDFMHRHIETNDARFADWHADVASSEPRSQPCN